MIRFFAHWLPVLAMMAAVGATLPYRDKLANLNLVSAVEKKCGS